jgi:hypothetical protein
MVFWQKVFPPGAVIDSVVPPGADHGTVVHVYGSGFANASAVSFGSIPATFAVNSDGQITATVPAGPVAAPIMITNPYATSESDSDFVIAPHLSAFYPQQAPVGHPVQFEGSGFLHTSSVRFGTTPASFVVFGDSLLRAYVPPGATSGSIVIENVGGIATTSAFAVGPMTGVHDGVAAFAVSSAQPNPSRDRVRWSLSLPATSIVRVAIYDAAGSRVRSLMDETRSAGRHEIEWEGRSNRGARARPGVYFLVVETALGIRRAPIVLLR